MWKFHKNVLNVLINVLLALKMIPHFVISVNLQESILRFANVIKVFLTNQECIILNVRNVSMGAKYVMKLVLARFVFQIEIYQITVPVILEDIIVYIIIRNVLFVTKNVNQFSK